MTIRRYLVSFRVVGEQTVFVEAATKREAKAMAINGIASDPVDFQVLHKLPSTVQIENIEDIL